MNSRKKFIQELHGNSRDRLVALSRLVVPDGPECCEERLVDERKVFDQRLTEALDVVPKDVVHPGPLGGCGTPKTHSPKEDPDEAPP